MTNNREEPLEKPYEFIDFTNAPRQQRAGSGHDSLHADQFTGQIELYLIARTPVQVANGSFDITKSRDGEEITAQGSSVQRYDPLGQKVNRQPVLPGSSIKGMMRSLLEMIGPCCVASIANSIRRELPSNVTRCSKLDQLCPACRLFGMSGAGKENYLGQISVEDARLIEGGQVIVRTPLLWAPARGARSLPKRYLLGNRIRGRKLYYPSQPARGPDARIAFKAGSTLRTVVHFANLTAGELGLLLTALGVHPQHRFIPKLGAGKPVGMGSVETYINRIVLYTSIRKQGRLGGKATIHREEGLVQQIGMWVQAAKEAALINETALHAVAELLHLRNLKRPPVEGMY